MVMYLLAFTDGYDAFSAVAVSESKERLRDSVPVKWLDYDVSEKEGPDYYIIDEVSVI